MEMAEELERAQLGVILGECWRGTLMYTDILLADSGAELQSMLDVVEAHVSRWQTQGLSCSLCWMW